MTPAEVEELVRHVQELESPEVRRAVAARWNSGARNLTSAEVVELRELRAAGADAHIAKPLEVERFLETLADTLQAAAAGDAAQDGEPLDRAS